MVTRLSNELAAVSGSDDAGRTTAEPSADGVLARWEDLLAFIVDPESPLVRGRDLVAWGLVPGPELGVWLDELYDAQLEGQITSLEAARTHVLQGRHRRASCGDARYLL